MCRKLTVRRKSTNSNTSHRAVLRRAAFGKRLRRALRSTSHGNVLLINTAYDFASRAVARCWLGTRADHLPLGPTLARETVPARGSRTVGAERQNLIARLELGCSRNRVRMARPNALDSRHNIQSSNRFLKREIGDVGSIADASSQIRRHVAPKMACHRPSHCCLAKATSQPKTAPWHTLPQASSLATFRDPQWPGVRAFQL